MTTDPQTVDAKDEARTKELKLARASLRKAYANFVNSDHGTPAHDRASKEFISIVASARNKGWPFQQIGQMVDLTGEAIRSHKLRFEATHGDDVEYAEKEFPDWIKPKRAAASKREVKAIRPRGEITDEEKQKLAELAPIASKAKGTTPLGSPIRKASEEFSDLVIRLKNERNVPWKDIADATEGQISISGLRMRAARHSNEENGGKWKVPPSVSRYRAMNIHEHTSDVVEDVVDTPAS